jgi:hypothetical protein
VLPDLPLSLESAHRHSDQRELAESGRDNACCPHVAPHVVRCGDNFLYLYQGHAFGAPGAQLRQAPRRSRSTGGQSGTGGGSCRRQPGWNGALAAGGRQPGPAPLARQRTGAGPLPHRGQPRRPSLAVPPSRALSDRDRTSSRGCPPAPGILSPRKLPAKGAPACGLRGPCFAGANPLMP